MFKTRKWYDGKTELIIISISSFFLLLILEIIFININNNILKVLPFFLIISLIFSILIYKILVFKILQLIVNKYFDLSSSNSLKYNEKLKMLDEYVKFYKKVFSKSDLEIIYFTKEIVTKHIEYKSSIKDSNYITHTS